MLRDSVLSRYAIVGGIACSLALAGLGTVAPVVPFASMARADAVAQGTVAEAEAKAIALEHAGLVEKDVAFSKVEQGTENGVKVYEVEFVSGPVEYEYDIDVATGEVVSYDLDAHMVASQPARDKGIKGPVDQKQAQSIALEHAGLAEKDVKLAKVEEGTEDKVKVFEVEFVSGKIKYEYDIEIATGAIVKYDLDYEADRDKQAADGNIGEEAALATALSDAGIAAQDATHVEVELDLDDTPVDFDVSFKVGDMEYEYEIDAATGAILKAESEIDD